MAIETPKSSTHDDNQDLAMRIEDIRKTFDNGNVVACEDISLEIAQDEFVVILGPSGCGKTTTLRCIAGLETPDEGSIYIDNDDVAQKKPKDRDLAFVFQSIALFPHMTVRENIRFGLDMKSDLELEEKNHRVKDVSGILGIEELLDRKPAALSGGQQQRVSLGRAMVLEPAAFLLDEPFSALDAQLRDQMRTEVKSLQRTLETAMIFVTHDQEEAMVLADKIVIMDNGRIQQVAPPKDIYSDPKNKFIAQFIGSPAANLLDCQFKAATNELEVNDSGISFPLPDAARKEAHLEDAQNLTFGIRPENVGLTVDSEESTAFSAEVALIEPHGDRDAVRLDNGSISINSIVDQDDYLPELNEEVGIQLDTERFWLFDSAGERLF